MSEPIRIGARQIGPGHPLFVIAELGLNHMGSSERALALVDAAAEAGASAVKLQSLVADRLVAESSVAPAHVRAASLREFFRRFELDRAAHEVVAKRARTRGLALLSTPFDEPTVDLLEAIGVDAYKVASGDITNEGLIRRVAATRKPVVMSTGMSGLSEIAAAVEWARLAGARHLVLLHCVSAYPVPHGGENLRAIAELSRVFRVPVGLSDHGANPFAAAVAVALGASVYERHLVLQPGGEEIDAAVSSSPDGLAAIVHAARLAQAALGSGRKVCQPAEAANVVASRRSLYAACDLREGDFVREDAVIALRPACGLEPRRRAELIGARLRRDVKAGTPFVEGDLVGAAGRSRAVA